MARALTNSPSVPVHLRPQILFTPNGVVDSRHAGPRSNPTRGIGSVTEAAPGCAASSSRPQRGNELTLKVHCSVWPCGNPLPDRGGNDGAWAAAHRRPVLDQGPVAPDLNRAARCCVGIRGASGGQLPVTHTSPDDFAGQTRSLRFKIPCAQACRSSSNAGRKVVLSARRPDFKFGSRHSERPVRAGCGLSLARCTAPHGALQHRSSALNPDNRRWTATPFPP